MRSAVIVANGQSSRYGGDKLSEDLLGRTVLRTCADVFFAVCDEIIIVSDESRTDDVPYAKFVKGGIDRTASVKNGLAAVSADCNYVAVHDGARPFVSTELVEKLFAEAVQFGSAVPRLPLTDTVWRQKGERREPENREELFAVQTPQVFNKTLLDRAFAEAKGRFTDESTMFFSVHGNVHFTDGQKCNYKITYRGDVPRFRIGEGFDVHAFGEGCGVKVGGVNIPFGKKLVGHSDADVLLHAVTDALLSASGQKDIGTLFPDNDDRYSGIDSMILLKKAADEAFYGGWEVCNVSAVIICELPKMAPYIDQMSSNIAAVLNVPALSVNISATTTEKLGALGRGDGIACRASALLVNKKGE